ncbi:hypothetical protein PV-S19_0183 [Pacmanvirus S19]|nr:hypothetical protein PV-S19_0183 [Pacmanvirus S19]
MDYELNKIEPTLISQQYDHDNSFGSMPFGMLTSKFSETNMGDDNSESDYDDYARSTLTDWRPDTATFAHEAPRVDGTKRSGILNLRLYGNRGEVGYNEVYRPEEFYELGGPDDKDPRGSNVDPDMKELRKQHEARTRFVKWDPDTDNSITGGGRSETQTMRDQQTIFKITRDRLKVFDRQIDGRKVGKSGAFKNKSCVPKQVLVKSYGDYIKDYATNPQRRATIICKQILRDSQAYRDETIDQDLAVAKYSQLGRRAKTTSKFNPMEGAADRTDNKFSDADSSKCYKAAGILMANIIRSKKQSVEIARKSDMDFATSQSTVARKTEPFVKDLAIVLRSIATDAEFKTADNTLTMKTAHPTIMEHLARQVTYNHLTPAHHYLNAEILYKSVKPGADTRKIKNLVITDANASEIQDLNTSVGKTAKLKMVSGAKLRTADDTDKSESQRTFNYKTALNPNGDKRLRLTSGEDYAGESDNTQNRRVNHQNYRTATADDVATDMKFLDNACKERRTRGLGTKYMNRFIDRDSREGEISETE